MLDTLILWLSTSYPQFLGKNMIAIWKKETFWFSLVNMMPIFYPNSLYHFPWDHNDINTGWVFLCSLLKALDLLKIHNELNLLHFRLSWRCKKYLISDFTFNTTDHIKRQGLYCNGSCNHCCFWFLWESPFEYKHAWIKAVSSTLF